VSATPATVRILDVSLPVTGQAAARAWLVTGEDIGGSQAGVLWLHWLGHLRNDRGEFLSHAVELASRGVVSLLPAGFFPWVPNPDGTAADVRLVRDQVAAHTAALDHLASQPWLDPARIAVVGHDYGGMYGALLAEADARVGALALQAVDARWGNWFSTYWLGLEGTARNDYAALFDGLDPVDHVARLGDRVLFQWAGQDTFVSPDVVSAYAAANPKARTHHYEKDEHILGDAAALDLVTFLAEVLSLDPV
jgi:pimeloyl-ACP methyl ester carboxylesterase